MLITATRHTFVQRFLKARINNRSERGPLDRLSASKSGRGSQSERINITHS